MVIGNGMIAKRFSDYQAEEAYIIFASGVSDSTAAVLPAFEKELQLLTETIEQNPGKILAYFSTCSIYDQSMQHSAYVQHKLAMEKLIIKKQGQYIIFRLSNPVGHTANTHTIVNYFIRKIQDQQPFEVWRTASRNIIDLDDAYTVCHYLLQTKLHLNKVINIANPQNYPVSYIVETIEKHFGTKGLCSLVDKGFGPLIDTTLINPLFREFNINFDENYLPDILQKYFPR